MVIGNVKTNGLVVTRITCDSLNVPIQRQKGDLDKEKRESQSAASAAQQRLQEYETAVKDFLEKAQIQPGNDLSATLQVSFLNLIPLNVIN